MDKNDIKEKVDDVKEDLERMGRKPIVRYMTMGFLALVVVLFLGSFVVSCSADADPRTDARTVVLNPD